MMADGLLWQLATLLSRLLHPVPIVLCGALVFSAAVERHLAGVVVDMAIVIGAFTPGLLVLQWCRRQGRRPHQIVLPLVLAGLLGASALFWLLGSPAVMSASLLIALCVGAGATVINRIWDISFHAMTPLGTAALLSVVAPAPALLFVGLGVLAGLARLPLKEHTLTEVLGGWAYGLVATGLLAWLVAGKL